LADEYLLGDWDKLEALVARASVAFFGAPRHDSAVKLADVIAGVVLNAHAAFSVLTELQKKEENVFGEKKIDSSVSFRSPRRVRRAASRSGTREAYGITRPPQQCSLGGEGMRG